jgi:hypothetical protein
MIQALMAGEKEGSVQRFPNDSRGGIVAWLQIMDQG